LAELDFWVHAIAAVVVSPFIGSFLATVAIRLPAGESLVAGRSRCPACKRALTAPDLVPVLSWILLHGRCRHCGAAIKTRYLVLELAALGVAFWAVFVVEGWLLWPTCLLGWTLLVLAAIDLEHFILPNAITLPLAGAGLAVAWLIDPALLQQHIAGAAGMYLAFVAVAAGYRRWRGREGLGRGDAKLAAAAGAWTSWTGAPGVVLLACASAFLFVLLRALRGKTIRARDRIAFGPFLCVGTWLIWLYGPLEFGGAVNFP
jgi:leader peptidase (prepilin peptidase)/N-methyltransferase